MNESPLETSRSSDLLAAAALVLLAVLGWELLAWDGGSAYYERTGAADRFFYDAGGGSHLLGLALAGWLVWRRRAALAAAATASSGTRLAAVALMGLAISIRAWSTHTGAIDLQLLALTLTLLGGGTWLAGWIGLRQLAVPALMVLVSAPIPPALVSSLIHPMQLMTAHGVGALLDWIGVPQSVIGEQIFTGAYAFYVIEGCAGLRALQSLALAAILYLELLYRDRRQVVLIALMTPLVAIAVNQLRVLLIVLSPTSSLSEDHTAQGVVMIILGVVVIAVFDLGLQRLEERMARRSTASGDGDAPPTDREPLAPSPSPSRPLARRWSAAAGPIILAALLFLGAGLMTPVWTSPHIVRARTADLPQRIGAWKAVRSSPKDREFFGSVDQSEWLQRRYESPGGAFELTLLADDHRRRSQNVLSPKIALGRPGRRIESSSPVVLRPSGRPATRLVVDGVGGLEIAIHWQIAARGPLEEQLRSMLALDQSTLFHRRERTLAVRVGMPLSADLDDARRQGVEILTIAGDVDRALDEVVLAGPPGSVGDAAAVGTGPGRAKLATTGRPRE